MAFFNKKWLLALGCCISLSVYADNAASTYSSINEPSITQITTYKTVVNVIGSHINEPFFVGKPMACAQNEEQGGVNCCGLPNGNNTLSSCTPEEQNLAEANKNGLAAFVGKSCLKTVNGTCMETESVYCVFPDRIAYLIQTDGRVQQLHQDFGTPDLPDCGGITSDQMKNIDLTAIDFDAKAPAFLPLGPGPVILPNRPNPINS